ncbi:hypothetical protein OnM2_078025 [Erysiphe neolycopersici]|uniref:DUF2293 domain-containing protein n=1 Tax=Erysiphe neolycopersici TaxID=212602 RepID=A0A420HH65_9PEZI|nr:hypothetical protein OnM2_078025 [Erysiphe neolycopersici]
MRETKGRTETLSLLRKKQENESLRKVSENIAKLRRARKLERRKIEKKSYTARDWAAPVPSNLVAKLDIPKHSSKYQSYFEFADNPEKKEKKLEFRVTNKVEPPPGYVFVPIGDPVLTNTCKELSREREAMFFIVSTNRKDQSLISEHVYRVGFHFREIILNTALKNLGERKLHTCSKDYIEPIPETQEEINKQADAAIRDLFPKIPNTDRQLIIEHSFKKGALYQGEPTVGTQSNIPLSRRVQLAVLAHIRHTHTRYDKLLRETSWINARKAVEPVCLDVILKWRGNEENGRDQMDEILREVVIITDSESDDEDDQSTSKNSSDEEDSPNTRSTSEENYRSNCRNKIQTFVPAIERNMRDPSPETLASRIPLPNSNKKYTTRDNLHRRGFKRYQVAWEEAIHRQQKPTNSVSNRPISERLPQSRDYSHNNGFYVGSSTRDQVIFDSVDQIPHNSDNRLLPMDKNSIAPLHTLSFYHGNNPEYPIIRSGEKVENYNFGSPVYYQNSAHRTGATTHPRLRQVSPQSMTRHGLQNGLVESIETASNKHSMPRTEEHVSDRFNYTEYSRPPRSDGLIYHEVEPLGATSNNIPLPYVEEYARDRFNYTQNSHSLWSDRLRPRLDGSTEAAFNEITPSRTERHVSDRFNYTQNPHPMCSDGFRQNIVESIEVAPNGIMPPYIEGRSSNRVSCTQKLYSRRSDGSRYQNPGRHQVVVIDDDNPRVESRRMTRYREPNSSTGYPHQDESLTIFQKSVPHLNNNFSDQSIDFYRHKLKDSPRITHSPSLNIGPTFLDSSFPTKSPAAIADTTMRLNSQSGHNKRVEPKTIPKPHIELVDLTSSSPTCDAGPYLPASEHYHGEIPRVIGQNSFEGLRSEKRRPFSPSCYSPMQKAETYGKLSYSSREQIPMSRYNYSLSGGQNLNIGNYPMWISKKPSYG